MDAEALSDRDAVGLSLPEPQSLLLSSHSPPPSCCCGSWSQTLQSAQEGVTLSFHSCNAQLPPDYPKARLLIPSSVRV